MALRIIKLANNGLAGPNSAVVTQIRALNNNVFNNISQNESNGDGTGKQRLHLTVQRDYPQVAPLPIPANIDANESVRFSPQRSRDIAANEIQCHHQSAVAGSDGGAPQIDITSMDNTADPHMGSYDQRGGVNLYCTMQSNVPEPFGGMHKFTHLNMPGGQWEQGSKYMSETMQTSHYTNLRDQVRHDWNNKTGNSVALAWIRAGYRPLSSNAINTVVAALKSNPMDHTRSYSTANPKNGSGKAAVVEEQKTKLATTLSKRDQLKRAITEYGSTVIVFHVGISLCSLGICYALVSSGLDVVALMESLNISNEALTSKLGAGASTFVIAYAGHKLLAPLRISITLGATPFIVRYLRKRGILKPPTQSYMK